MKIEHLFESTGTLGSYVLRFEMDYQYRIKIQEEIQSKFSSIKIKNWEQGFDFHSQDPSLLEQIEKLIVDKNDEIESNKDKKRFEKTFVSQGISYRVANYLGGDEIRGINPNIEGILVFDGAFPSFKNADKHLKSLTGEGKLYCYGGFHPPCLGLLKVRGLKQIIVLPEDDGASSSLIRISEKVGKILTRALNGEIDEFDCQDILLEDPQLKEYGKV